MGAGKMNGECGLSSAGMLDAGCWMLDAGCWMLGSAFGRVRHRARPEFAKDFNPASSL